MQALKERRFIDQGSALLQTLILNPTPETATPKTLKLKLP